MTFVEQAIVFDCAAEPLLGVFAAPADGVAPGRAAVLIIVGGPQYRAGSHRQFVLLARAMAAQGHAVLRFDYRGMGDSAGTPRDFNAISADIGAAVDTLRRLAPAADRLVLFGLCDAASAALMYLHETHDRRIGGLCLLNPWARSEAGLARTHVKHYYLQRIGSREFWGKLLRGGVGLGRLAEFAASVRRGFGPGQSAAAAGSAGAFLDKMRLGWRWFEGRSLLVLSGDDLTAKEFLEQVAKDSTWQQLMRRDRVRRVDLPEADHTFSVPACQRQLEAEMLGWLSEGAAAGAVHERGGRAGHALLSP